jgi:biopolymer transport protein ExbD
VPFLAPALFYINIYGIGAVVASYYKNYINMATLNNSEDGKAIKGSTRKQIPTVDLTAMVDLAFLLITFFMLTTSLSKPVALDVVKPVPITNVNNLQEYPASRTMTILLGKDEKAVCYLGVPNGTSMKVVNTSKIGPMILNYKTQVEKSHQVPKDKVMLVIIKPTDRSVYKNFVDVLDEMKINKIETYAIDDKYILPEELNFLKNKQL